MIRVVDLSFRYPPPVPGTPAVSVLDGLSFEVAQGEAVALMGPIGAGKTTLLLTLAGLAPEMTGGELSGNAWIGGREVRQQPLEELGRHVGLVFQHADHQLFNMSVLDEVAFGLEGLGLPPAEIEARAYWALDRLGLGGHLDRAPWQLSGGEQKRLALATVLALQPPVILLDEPMAGLDPIGRRAISDVLHELKRSAGTTILVAEQDPEFVARWADRVIVLAEGRLAFDGPVRKVFSDVTALHRLGVDTPQMSELSAALRAEQLADISVLTSTEAAQALAPSLQRHQSTVERKPQASDSPLSTVSGAAAPPAISLRDLHFRYEDGPQALNGVSLEIPAGQFVALVGPNGSGKSTLIRHLNGLLRPQRGEVRIAGTQAAGKRVGELARLVGYVFQNPDHQIFAPTVREELAFGPRNLGLQGATLAERVEAALQTFNLVDLAEVPPAILGYGQRRLVTVAGTWAMQPPIWVLDEPTTGLDRRATQAFMAQVAALHRAGHTIVLVTHDMRLVAEHAERVIVMLAGRIVLDGSPADVFARAEGLRPYGLRPPPVTRLAHKLETWGVPGDILTIPDFLAQYRLLMEQVRRGT